MVTLLEMAKPVTVSQEIEAKVKDIKSRSVCGNEPAQASLEK